jgi:hypothetical protein
MATSDAEDDRFQSASPAESGNEQDDEINEHATSKGDKGNSSSNVKDPNRPRRKKARRACFACQRAHLTCGMHVLVQVED